MVLCKTLPDHLFNNSRMLLSVIKLHPRNHILHFLEIGTFCSYWLVGPSSLSELTLKVPSPSPAIQDHSRWTLPSCKSGNYSEPE